ncbi:MAG: hypothetical protein KAJ07_01785 [Planctomycetes bacterium]|nr:hypothetical protein [Planctomycetota bacterium]
MKILSLKTVLVILIAFQSIGCTKTTPAGDAQDPDGTAAKNVRRYNVVWQSPSKDATGVMPIGNGDMAAGVYAIANGDLYLLMAKNDAYNRSGEIYKSGRVRISLKPNPFQEGKAFIQTLDLATGSIAIEADDVKMRLWVDANNPVCHVQIDAADDIEVRAVPEFWDRLDGTKDQLVEGSDELLWYFAVGDKSVYPDDVKYYEFEEAARDFPDPYRFNTFGNLLTGTGVKLQNKALEGKGKKFDLRIYALTMQTPKPETWTDTITAKAEQPVDTQKAWDAHCKWWRAFWDRSWIITSDNTLPAEDREKFMGAPDDKGMRPEKDGAALVAQSYNVFRFLMACQSRGRVQTKFNGGLFTQQLLVPADIKRHPGLTKQPNGTWLTHEDDRLWGRRYTFQNQRLLYWPMLMSGDYEMMEPFFNYYWRLLPIRKAITKAWFGHEGAYYRENIEPTGAERDCGRTGKPMKLKPGENKGQGFYHSFYFTCGLEIVTMMIDYVNYTGDLEFRDEVLTPFAREILLFFDKHYTRDAEGKLLLDPAMVVETFWIAVNPSPDIAALQFSMDQLLVMDAGTAEDKANWKRFRSELPEIPIHTIDGKQAIAPAEKWDKKMNAENGELYPVFPFRCYGIALGSKDIVDWTMKHRTCKDAFNNTCWTQDQIHWAYAGNAEEAAKGLVRRFRTASTMCRFPLYGKEFPDSCPDFDHFGSGSTALQRMLVQEADGKIVLLPAWPADWDVDFKLHLENKTTITGTVTKGELVEWNIQPASRKKDVVVYKPQKHRAMPGPK